MNSNELAKKLAKISLNIWEMKHQIEDKDSKTRTLKGLLDAAVWVLDAVKETAIELDIHEENTED